MITHPADASCDRDEALQPSGVASIVSVGANNVLNLMGIAGYTAYKARVAKLMESPADEFKDKVGANALRLSIIDTPSNCQGMPIMTAEYLIRRG